MRVGGKNVYIGLVFFLLSRTLGSRINQGELFIRDGGGEGRGRFVFFLALGFLF